MKRTFKFLLFALFVSLLISGCNRQSGADDVFKYKDSYVGDASAVGNSVRQLQGADYHEGFELKTSEEPYGIILNYDWSEAELDAEQTAIYNATFLFALIKNANWITFNFDEETYKITREELQEWYGENLSHLENEAETKELAQKYLEDESKVNQLFNE